jgi:type IV pilus biogenesis protein CpaD/CtpE
MRPAAPLTSLLLLAAWLAGCQEAGETYWSKDFGNAVRHNMAVQAANPDPAPPASQGTGLEGNRAALAYGRYLRDRVEPPRDIRTTTTVGGGGGGGGGGGAAVGAGIP